MANAVVISRSNLIYGLCLPLAVLLGYLLAEPFESGSVAVVVLVISVLSIPILMRWHHPLLIFACNAAIYPYFVPGRPMLWMIMALVSAFFLLLNRSMGREVRFFRAPQVSLSLIFLGLVVMATAYVNGGIGLHYFGSQNTGGKRYLTLMCGILLYFGLSTLAVEGRRSKLAIAVFFLSSLTGLVGYLAAFAGPSSYFLVELFPIEGGVNEVGSIETPEMMGMGMGQGIVRLGGLTGVAIGLFTYLLARYGLRGTFDLTRPWRMLFFLVAVIATLYSGFRSNLILLLLTVAVMFIFEGLFRTRLMLILIVVGAITVAIGLPYTQKLPQSVQRTLCFLPINVDPMVRQDADNSTNWRLEMWQDVLPTVPRYLFKGKGFGVDADEMFLIQNAQGAGYVKPYEEQMFAGNYHSGPLSLIIPLGIFGTIAFVWFVYAAIKVLAQNRRYGDPALHRINTFLLAFFIVHVLFFIFVFGAIAQDLAVFAGIIGLGVSLNGGVQQPRELLSEPEPE
jgi:O-Antigen ligase